MCDPYTQVNGLNGNCNNKCSLDCGDGECHWGSTGFDPVYGNELTVTEVSMDTLKVPVNGWTCACNTNFTYRNYQHYIENSQFFGELAGVPTEVSQMSVDYPPKCFNESMINDFVAKLQTNIDSDIWESDQQYTDTESLDPELFDEQS